METKTVYNNKLSPRNIVLNVILEQKEKPFDLFERGPECDEYKYLEQHKDEYMRTVDDLIVQFSGRDYSGIKVLEIGSFLGIVSIALSRLGFQVTALDIPEFITSKNAKNEYEKNRVTCVAHNLKELNLPFDDNQFDAIIMCETLEHLNFNPLPLLKDINRILHEGGIFYVSVPNLVRKRNRIKMIRGEPIHNPIEHFFTQLKPNSYDIVGLHWREYTVNELKEMLEKMGFEIISQNFFEPFTPKTRQRQSLKSRILSFFFTIPFIKSIILKGYPYTLNTKTDRTLLQTQVTTTKKIQIVDENFVIAKSLN